MFLERMFSADRPGAKVGCRPTLMPIRNISRLVSLPLKLGKVEWWWLFLVERRVRYRDLLEALGRLLLLMAGDWFWYVEFGVYRGLSPSSCLHMLEEIFSPILGMSRRTFRVHVSRGWWIGVLKHTVQPGRVVIGQISQMSGAVRWLQSIRINKGVQSFRGYHGDLTCMRRRFQHRDVVIRLRSHLW